jgi:hypothetical protein
MGIHSLLKISPPPTANPGNPYNMIHLQLPTPTSPLLDGIKLTTRMKVSNVMKETRMVVDPI